MLNHLAHEKACCKSYGCKNNPFCMIFALGIFLELPQIEKTEPFAYFPKGRIPNICSTKDWTQSGSFFKNQVSKHLLITPTTILWLPFYKNLQMTNYLTFQKKYDDIHQHQLLLNHYVYHLHVYTFAN